MMKINRIKEALVSQELLRELLRYECDTGVFYWISRGRGRKFGQPVGCVDKVSGYVRIRINNYTYKAHRLAWLYVYGEFPDGKQPYIDHINGKKDDNRISNLRCSSIAENARNMEMTTRNTSGIVGVFRTSAWNGVRTKLNWYWRASWHDENCKQRRKNFSIETYGEDVAKQMAIDYRAEQIRLLEINHGITYSERHGI